MAAPGFDAQRAVRMQAAELTDYMAELFSWSKGMKQKEAERKRKGSEAADALPVKGRAAEPAPLPPAVVPPVKPTVAAAAAPSPSGGQQQQSASGQPRHPAGHTYEHYRDKWDKFDVDAALADEEQQSGSSAAAAGGLGGSLGAAPQRQPTSSAPMSIPQARVTVPVALSHRPGAPSTAAGAAGPAPTTSAVPAAGPAPTTAEGWKDAGNAHFKRGQHLKAVECYSSSLVLQASCLAFANRAMAQLKLGQAAAAEADCTQAVRLDPLYVKAYHRRATARQQQGKLLGAVQDFEYALRLEPSNKQAAADRAACVKQLLQQQGLQPPTCWEQLPVAVPPAAAASATAAAAAAAEVVPLPPPAAAAAVAATPAVGAPPSAEAEASDAFIKVSSVQRQKPAASSAAGPAAAAAGPAAAQGTPSHQQQGPEQQQAAATATAHRPSAAAPMAAIQVIHSDGAESIPDLAEPAQQAEQPPPGGSGSPLQPLAQPVHDAAAAAVVLQAAAAPAAPPAEDQHAAPTAAGLASAAAAAPHAPPLQFNLADPSSPAQLPAASPAAPSASSPAAPSAVLPAQPASAAASPPPPAAAAGAAEPAAAARPATAAAAAAVRLRVPRTGVEFEKAWKGLKGDSQQQAAYLLALQPAQLPSLLKQALTPGLLAAAAAALLRPGLLHDPEEQQQQGGPAAAVALLEGLTQVPRFDINLMSVPQRQKAELWGAWDAAQAELAAADAGLADRLASVRRKYKL